jgi:hypothetical protein
MTQTIPGVPRQLITAINEAIYDANSTDPNIIATHLATLSLDVPVATVERVIAVERGERP